jgi:hypothetical protein
MRPKFAAIAAIALATLSTSCAQTIGGRLSDAGSLRDGAAFNSAPRRGSAWSSEQQLLYVSGDHEVLIYSQTGSHKPIGQIRDGIKDASGLAVDSQNTLYVANRDAASVTEYLEGSVHPSLAITSGLEHPLSVAVDAQLNVYVCDFDGQVVEYHAGQTTPFLVIPPVVQSSSQGEAVDAVVDPEGNLYVSYLFHPPSTYFQGQIAMYPPGGTSPTWTGIVLPFTADIAFDAQQHLLVAVPQSERSGPSGIFEFRLQPLKNLRRFGDRGGAYAMRFSAGARRLYVGDLGHKMFVYSYPDGKLIDSFTVKTGKGLALSPPGPN